MMKHLSPPSLSRTPLFAALALALAGPALAQNTLTLQECLDAGLKGNLDLQRLEEGTELTRSQIEEAKSSYYPTLKASGSIVNMWDKPYSAAYQKDVGNRWTTSGGLTLSQPIFVAQVLTGVKVAKKGLELDGLGKQAQRDGVIQQLATLYWTAVYLEENQTVLVKSRDNLVRVQTTVQALVDNGVAKKSDLNSMDISISSLNATVEKMGNQVAAQKTALLQAMGRAPQSDLVLADRLAVDKRNVSELSGDALQNSTALKILENQVELKDMQETLTGQSRWPTVVAFAKYSTEGTSESFDFYDNPNDKFTDTGVLGVQVDMPIFDGMSASINKTQIRIEKRQLQIDIAKKRLALQADAADAKRSLATARSQVERQVANVRMSEENFAMKELEYKEQVSALSDLLTAENDVISARSSLVEALYNEKTAELELKQVLGLLAQEVK
jgi:outer membrane protein